MRSLRSRTVQLCVSRRREWHENSKDVLAGHVSWDVPAWMRFYGLLFGKKAEADAMFASVERSYKDLQELVKPISFAPSVMCDLKTSSTWYTPGGNSTIARLYADAGANYIFREDTHSGSLPYPFEVIFEKGQQTDFWLIRYNQPIDKTYKELEKEFAPYAGFRAFKERNIYVCNTNQIGRAHV